MQDGYFSTSTILSVRFFVLIMLYPYIIKNTKEVTEMKTAVIRPTTMQMRQNIPHPNAATRKEMLHKFLDLLVMGAVGAGLSAATLFWLVLA